MSIKPILKMVAKFCQKNATKILAGGAIISEVVGFWMMHKQAPVVHEKLEALPEDATTMDKIKTAAPLYLPAALMLLTSSGCIVGGCALGEARLAAMTNLAMMSEAALAKYERKVVETIGEDEAKKLHSEIANEVANEKVLPEPTRVIATSNGSDIFYDPLSERYFASCEKAIYDAANSFNNKYGVNSMEMFGSVNDWYDELGISQAILGEYAGWNIDHTLKVSLPREWENTPDGRPCKRIVYWENPVLLNGSSHMARD